MEDDQVDLQSLLERAMRGEIDLDDMLEDVGDLDIDEVEEILEMDDDDDSSSFSEFAKPADQVTFLSSATDVIHLSDRPDVTYGEIHGVYSALDEEAKRQLIQRLKMDGQYEAIVWIITAGELPATLAQSFNVGSSACTVQWSGHDMNYHCATCQVDPTCALCTDCWIPELHEGHDFGVTLSGGGVCDCGDVSAWDPNTFCPRHKLSNDVNPVAQLPTEFSSRATEVLASVCSSPLRKEDVCLTFGLLCGLVDLFQDPMRQLVSESFRLEEYASQFPSEPALQELLFKLLPFEPFKMALGVFVVAHYGTIYEQQYLTQLTVQLFTNPSVAEALVTQHAALDVIFDHCASLVTPEAIARGKIPEEILVCAHDLFYLIRHAAVWPHLQAHPESLIAFLSKFQYRVCLTRKTGDHELYDTAQARAASGVIWMWGAIQEMAPIIEKMCHSYETWNARLLEALQPMKLLPRASLCFLLPLHRLLARTLVECPISCVSLEHAEAPLRFLTFLSSHDPGGLWKRNGETAATFAFYYVSPSFCQATIDRDIFLVQCVAAQVDPDTFVAKLRHLFGALEGTPSCLLHTLLLVMLDRSLCGAQSAADEARRLMIHALAVGPAAYSKLAKRLPVSVTEHAQYEVWLKEVADFSSPVYSLKEDLWQHTCIAHFSHYTAESRQKALSNYNAAMDRARQIPQGLKVAPPAPVTLRPILPKYAGLLRLLEREDLWQLCLDNLTAEDETLVTLCFEWLSLCAQHNSPEFVAFSLRSVLLSSLQETARNPAKLYHHSCAARVLADLSKNDNVANRLSEMTQAASSVLKQETPEERRARMKAKMMERQRKMKEAMQAKTQAFMEHHNIESLDEIEDTRGGEEETAEADECVLCHSSETTEDNPRRKRDQCGPDPDLAPADDDTLETLIGKGEGIVKYDLGVGVEAPHLVIRRCGHTIHRECHQEYVGTVLRNPREGRQRGLDTTTGEYVCPMCRCVNNTVIPHPVERRSAPRSVSQEVTEEWDITDDMEMASADYMILSNQVESLLYGYPLPTTSFVLSRVVCATIASSLLCSPESFVARGYRGASRLCADLCPFSPHTARVLLDLAAEDSECDAFALFTRLVLCFYNSAADVPLGNIFDRCLQIAKRQQRLESFYRRAHALLDTLELPQLVDGALVEQQVRPSVFVELPRMFQEKQWYLPKLQSACPVCATVPRQPALCLLCGQVVCAVDPCCARGPKGEATLHLEEEHGGIGVYLMLKNAAVFVLYKGVHGRNYPSFYLDKHGEEYTQGAPLYLNKEKYEALQSIYVENRLIDLCVDSEQYLRLPSWASF